MSNNGTTLRHDCNAQYNGRCARLVLSPDGTQLLFVNDRGEYNVERVGAPTYTQALQIAERRAMVEGVSLEVSV